MFNPFIISYFESNNSDLESAVNELIDYIVDSKICLSLNFFIDTCDESFLSDYILVNEIVAKRFDIPPLISIIPQCICGQNTVGMECLQNDNSYQVAFKEFQDVRYFVFQSEFGDFLQIDGVRACSLTAPYLEQCTSLFIKIKSILDIENFEVNNIIRQWNYIGDITGFEDGNQHYQLFNNARTEFYENSVFVNGYPAATGISISTKCVLVSIMALKANEKTRILSIDNTSQIPAYNYSSNVLVDGKTNHLLSTPKFERGKLITNGHNGVFFVSGTAAILNQESKFSNDASKQALQTIQNINFLLSTENFKRQSLNYELNLSLKSIRVYIKNMEDYHIIKSEVEKNWQDLEVIYLLAEVCREELLVEIEGVAS